jgi:hypothetical protein
VIKKDNEANISSWIRNLEKNAGAESLKEVT